jgi:hypothetical protein
MDTQGIRQQGAKVIKQQRGARGGGDRYLNGRACHEARR